MFSSHRRPLLPPLAEETGEPVGDPCPHVGKEVPRRGHGRGHPGAGLVQDVAGSLDHFLDGSQFFFQVLELPLKENWEEIQPWLFPTATFSFTSRSLLACSACLLRSPVNLLAIWASRSLCWIIICWASVKKNQVLISLWLFRNIDFC